MRPMAISLLVPHNVSQSLLTGDYLSYSPHPDTTSLDEGQGRLRLLCGTMSAVAVPLLCRRGALLPPLSQSPSRMII